MLVGYTYPMKDKEGVYMKKILYYVCILALCIAQISCGKQKDTVQNTEETADAKVQIERITYSEKDLQTGYTDAVELTLKDGEDIQITEGGTYRLTGTLEEGQILVDAADEDVRLVLAGVEVQNNGSAALYVREAKNVYVTLDAGTENILSAAGEFVQTDENNVDAAVFSKSDLIMNGTGSLTVHCETGHGIVTKDDLTITGGTFDVTAAGQCIVGKDSVAVADGIFTLSGGKDGIHSEHEDTAKGNVCLDGGTFTIRTDGDGVSASGTMLVTGGTYDILTGGGSANAVQSDGEDRMGGGMQMPGGMGGRGDRGDMGGGMMPGGMDRPEGMPEGMMPGEIPQGMELPEGMMPGEMPEGMVSGGMQMPSGSMPGEIPDTAEQATQTTDTAVVDSCKGLKAGGSMAITGGSFIIDTADDAIHTNADLSVAGGTFTLSSGDDGIHGDGNVEISAGTVEILTSYEGIEGQTIHLAGGEITLTASDDGLNAAGGNDSSGFGGFFGGKDMFTADAAAGVTISGGTLVITAAGDGIDSNGYLRVTGGTTCVNGPTNSANGALDYAAEGTVTGGTFIALGAAGMAMNFDSSSTQGAAMCSVNGSAGGMITLTDDTGKELVCYSPLTSYNCMVISVPGMAKGETYTLTVDGSSQTIEMTDTVAGSGGMMGGGFGGFGGRGEGGRQPGGPGGW